jgi:4-hydroxy-tetrahydrodipicolinate reductase
MNLGIFGYGKMGKSIKELSKNYKIISSVFVCEKNQEEEFIDRSDAIVDFSNGDATGNLMSGLLKKPKPILIGTTSLSENTLKNAKKLSAHAPVIISANVSIGANLIAEMSAKISSMLNNYDIDITERHHKQKLDSPSGTALMIAKRVMEQNLDKGYKIITSRNDNPVRGDNEITISAIRAGNIIGEHTAIFTSHQDSIEITHRLHDRSLLADNAIKIAIWLQKQKPNLYKMKDFLGEF